MYEQDTMPQAVEEEKTILGAILLDNAALEESERVLKADDFSLDSNRRIFLRMSELGRTGHSIDIVTLSRSLAREKEIETVGGVAYLASLTEGLPRRPVIEEYIRVVKDASLLRQMMLICNSAIAKAADHSEPAMNVLGDTLERLSSIENAAQDGQDLESVGQWLNSNDVFEERQQGIPTGITDYDEMTYGLHKGELTVFAGRTSSGKTSHAGTIAWQMARRGKAVAVFLNEQAKKSFIGRMLCGRSGVSFSAYRHGRLGMMEKIYIEDAIEEFKKLPIFWDVRPGMSAASIRSKAQRLKRSGDLDVVVIDQLNGISGEGFWQKGMRGDEVLGRKVIFLKRMGLELDVPVVLYHQLNRQSTKNEDSRPTLTDLKNSGEIEEHADNVALLHRPGYYKRNDPTLEGKAEILLAKQRDGATGSVHCEFVEELCLWRNRSTR